MNSKHNSLNDKYGHGWEMAYQHGSQDQSLWKEQPIEFLPGKVPTLKSLGVRSILDAVCGDARNLLFLAQQGFNGTGLDISPSGLAKANRKLRGANIPACLVDGDLVELPAPFPEGLFDAVACLDVFGQIPDTGRMVTGFRKVLADGGFLLVNFYTPDDQTFGEGIEIAPNTFEYKDTLFKFFTETTVPKILLGFEIIDIDHMSWEDPPHGDFRPYQHIHDSLVVLAQKV